MNPVLDQLSLENVLYPLFKGEFSFKPPQSTILASETLTIHILGLLLSPGLASMAQNLEPVLKKPAWDWA